MPFSEVSKMDQRLEFCRLADAPGSNMAQLCARFGVSRHAGYVWLRRYRERGTAGQTVYTRFEHDRPNALWQMDFKGHVGLKTGARLHPLTVLDDHSRCAWRRAPTSAPARCRRIWRGSSVSTGFPTGS